MKLSSTKPYLLRAFYEWITDNVCTPYIIINAEDDDVEVPRQYVDDGRIVLNISSSAVRNLKITNQAVQFDARFGGVAMLVNAPIKAVMAIYAHENGRGMVFEPELEEDREAIEALDDEHDDDSTPPSSPRPKGKPTLRIIK